MVSGSTHLGSLICGGDVMKKITQLRNLSNEDLKKRLGEIGNSLMRAVGKTKAGGQYSEDTMYIRKLRREKAQILTLLGERARKTN